MRMTTKNMSNNQSQLSLQYSVLKSLSRARDGEGEGISKKTKKSQGAIEPILSLNAIIVFIVRIVVILSIVRDRNFELLRSPLCSSINRFSPLDYYKQRGSIVQGEKPINSKQDMEIPKENLNNCQMIVCQASNQLLIYFKLLDMPHDGKLKHKNESTTQD